ncbi:lysophospholipase [Neolewinella sp.]|uniref:alpha/beta hydrolase n=1 Tax=Neolewinella sp. TaxID=2993543 RepID=UPI003B528192
MQEFHWTNEQGHRIYAVDWDTPNPRAVVGIIHGLGEHCRRYDALAAFFHTHRVAAVGYDRQGFGRSEGQRGHAASYTHYLDGVAQLLVQCQRRYSELPVFLYGQSMGGQLLLTYLIKRKPRITGAVVTSPHIATGFRPNPLVVGLGKLLRRVRPSQTLDNQLDLTRLSRDPEVQRAYTADPLNHQRLSAQVGLDLLERAKFLQDYAGGLTVPTLLLHGSADGITAHDATEAFATRNPAGVHWRSYPGFYHELHNEPGREEVLGDIWTWMENLLDTTTDARAK